MNGFFTALQLLIDAEVSELTKERINRGEYAAREQYELIGYPLCIIGDLTPGGEQIQTTEFECTVCNVDVTSLSQKDDEAWKIMQAIKNGINGKCSDPIKFINSTSFSGTVNNDGVFAYTVTFEVQLEG